MQISSSTTSPYTGMSGRPAPRQSSNTDADADADTDTDTASVTDTPDATQAASTPANESSSVKQFACGALGLDSPAPQDSETNQFYTAGKWVAAAVTIGKIVSLFV